MTNNSEEMRGPALVRDDILTTELRGMVAAPVDPGYWEALERRIMARIEKSIEEGRWWALSERFYQFGLMAAGFALIVAGSFYLRSRAVEARMAYESVIESPSVDLPIYARRGPLDH